jgi:hypothetical protein
LGRIGKARIKPMNNGYISEELFHFVGYSSPKDDEKNYETLCKVLSAKCISHPPHDQSRGKISYRTEWDQKLSTEELIVPTVTCFADIPFDSLSVHIEKYGRFGVALPRDLLIMHGARPVMYFPLRSDDWNSLFGQTLLNDIEAIVKGFNDHVFRPLVGKGDKSRSLGVPPPSLESAISAMQSMVLKDFLAFIKPFNSELSHNDQLNYYMEREWRKYGNMQFEKSDLTKVIVATSYKERLENDFPILKNRILEIF